jgi:RNA polymerase sigma-70 factor, ECF subfamily
LTLLGPKGVSDAGPLAELPEQPDGLVDRARRGDEVAFAILWRTLQPPLLRYLHVVAGPAADDMASEAWSQVVRDLHRFDGDGLAFRGWLFTIARHRAIDSARYRGRKRRTPVGGGRSRVMASAEEEATTVLSTHEALHLLAELPARQAEAVALRVIAGFDTASAASIAQTSTAALRVNLHRGLRCLAQDPRLRELQDQAQ